MWCPRILYGTRILTYHSLSLMREKAIASTAIPEDELDMRDDFQSIYFPRRSGAMYLTQGVTRGYMH